MSNNIENFQQKWSDLHDKWVKTYEEYKALRLDVDDIFLSGNAVAGLRPTVEQLDRLEYLLNELSEIENHKNEILKMIV